MAIKCMKCGGTGDMGLISASLCNNCNGTGMFALDSDDHVALYEWMEGYLDDNTSDEWLINQLQILILARKNRRK
jgi:hypothetical protein